MPHLGKGQVWKEISTEETPAGRSLFDDVKKFFVATHVAVEVGNEKATYHDAFSTIDPKTDNFSFNSS